jgi:hypothetical protein
VKNERGDTVKYIGTEYLIQDENLAHTLYNRQAKKLNLPLLQEAVPA